MKRAVIFGVVLAAMMAVSFASANDDYLPTVVNGIVYMEDGQTPVSGVMVTATCNEIELSDETNDQGLFNIVFDGMDCMIGDEVTLGTGETAVTTTVKEGTNTVNLAFANIRVPEFGAIAGALAVLGAGAAYMRLRKK